MFIYSNVLPDSLTVEEAGEVLRLAKELELKGSLATLQKVLPKVRLAEHRRRATMHWLTVGVLRERALSQLMGVIADRGS